MKPSQPKEAGKSLKPPGQGNLGTPEKNPGGRMKSSDEGAISSSPGAKRVDEGLRSPFAAGLKSGGKGQSVYDAVAPLGKGK